MRIDVCSSFRRGTKRKSLWGRFTDFKGAPHSESPGSSDEMGVGVFLYYLDSVMC